MTNPYPEHKRTVLTTPVETPQRTWVELTEDEIQTLLSQNRFAVFALIRAVEAKLNQKNGYAKSPQRTWVDLTEEEIYAAIRSTRFPSTDITVSQSVIEAFKEKNK